MKTDSNTVLVTGTSSLAEGAARTFPVPDSDQQGFVIRTGAGMRAFLNRCRHWPVELDAADADFWNPDARMIQCKVHGALFRPDDGLCVYGPCSGHPLHALPVVEHGDDCMVTIPDNLPRGY